jgi:5'-phosphate synthase pdxT subunit
MDTTVGVLALQGAYQKHIDMLHTLGIPAHTVRYPDELDDCSALIIPGGESTTISLLMQNNGLYEPIKAFAEHHPVMGVCAGMIMMATEVDDDRVTPLGLIPFKALRNHYGRQVHSFTTVIKLDFDSKSPAFPAIFIRAPGVDKLSKDVQILARNNNNDEAVILSKGQHMALSFHPELTDDTRIHAYWLSRFSDQQ